MLRPGSVGSFTAADHIAVLDAALAQIPPGHRDDLLVAVDGAGASNDLVDHLTGLNTTAVRGRRGTDRDSERTPHRQDEIRVAREDHDPGLRGPGSNGRLRWSPSGCADCVRTRRLIAAFVPVSA